MSSSEQLGWLVRLRCSTFEDDEDETDVAEHGEGRFPVYVQETGEWGAKDDAEGDLGDDAAMDEEVRRYSDDVQEVEEG